MKNPLAAPRSVKLLINKLYHQFHNVKVFIAVLLFSIYFAAVTLSGGSVIELAKFWLVAGLYIILPGMLINDSLKISKQVDESQPIYSVSIALGIGFFSAIFCVAARFQVWGIVKVIPLMAGGAYLVAFREKMYLDTKNLVKQRSSQLSFLLIVWASIMFMYSFVAVVKHAHPALVGQLNLSQDFMWTVGNAQSFKLNFPPIDIRFDGVRLWYHYLTELLTAGISVVSGVSCYNILGFYMQSFMMLFFILAAYEFGRFFYNQNILKANLFLLSFFGLSCLSLWKALPNGQSRFSNSLLQTLISNVNSQATAFAFLCVFCLIIFAVFRKEGNCSLVFYLGGFGVFFLLLFSKSPISAIVALALISAGFINLLTKKRNFKTICYAVGIFLLFGVIYVGVLSSGSKHSTMFHLTKTMEVGYFSNIIFLLQTKNKIIYQLAIPALMVLQTFCIAPFQFIVVVPQILKDGLKLFRLSFEQLFIYACIGGGLLAFFISYHEAFSQVYFLYVALFFLNLLAIQHFDFQALNIKNLVPYLCLILSMITTLFMYINFGGSGIRQLLFNYDILPKYPYAYTIKAEDELAGQFLKQNMQPDEKFITNRIHTGANEGLSNVYTCFSGKQAYMEGFKYTVSNMGVSWPIVQQKLDVVQTIFALEEKAPASFEEIQQICKGLETPYIVYSSQFEGDTTQLQNFDVVFAKDTVTIYKIY